MDILLVIAFILASGLLCAILEIRSQQRRIMMYRNLCDTYRERLKQIVRKDKEED